MRNVKIYDSNFRLIPTYDIWEKILVSYYKRINGCVCRTVSERPRWWEVACDWCWAVDGSGSSVLCARTLRSWSKSCMDSWFPFVLECVGRSSPWAPALDAEVLAWGLLRGQRLPLVAFCSCASHSSTDWDEALHFCFLFRPLQSLALHIAVLPLQRASGSSGVLCTHRLLGPHPELLTQSVRGGPRDSTFLISSQVMLRPLIQVLPFENHCCKTLTFNKTNKRSYWIYSRKKMHGIYCYLDWTLYCFSLSGCWLLH